MKISGFTIVRNGMIYGYPFIESIQSILPLCDEFIINYGVSDDATLQHLLTIQSPKIKILERQWDMSLREDGKLLAVETNHALDVCIGDWCFYIQADEVVHEKYYPVITSAMEKYKNDDTFEGLRFGYEHFYGNYDYVQDNFRLWYIQEVRVIKNRRNIRSWGDAMGFKHSDGSNIKSKRIDAKIYHYGWARPPQVMITKKENFEKLYHSDAELEKKQKTDNVYTHLGHLIRFTETHPQVMQERVRMHNWDFDAKLETQFPQYVRYVILFFEPLTKRIRRIFGKSSK